MSARVNAADEVIPLKIDHRKAYYPITSKSGQARTCRLREVGEWMTFSETWIWDERKRIESLLSNDAAEALSGIGMTPDAYDYATSLRAHIRTPVFCTFWCLDPALRDALNRGIALHCLGIKLVDDLLDQDTRFSSVDLAPGVYLIQTGTAFLCTVAPPEKTHETLKQYYSRIWRCELAELRKRPSTFEEWLHTARIKAGEILECYTAIACHACNIEPINIPYLNLHRL